VAITIVVPVSEESLGLGLRRGVDRVDLQALHPALVEDKPRVLDGGGGRDVDRGLEVQPAAYDVRRGDGPRHALAVTVDSRSR